MSYSPSSPVTGAAQTGFTSPTYTLVTDTAPDVNGIQRSVSALGGTQAGVTVNSASAPFTITFVKPKVNKVLGPVGSDGILRRVGRNTWKLITRKAVTPLAGQAAVTALMTTTIEVPAGADLADPSNVRAMISAHVGMLNQQAAGIGDSVISGSM